MGRLNIFRVNGVKFESLNSNITGREVLELACLTPVEDYELLLKINEDGYEPIQLDEIIDLNAAGKENLTAKPYRKLIIHLDDEPVEVPYCFMTPDEILEASGKEPNGYYLKQIKGHIEIGYKNDKGHKIAIQNGLKFSSCKLEPTTVS